MIVVKDIKTIRDLIKKEKKDNKKIGFVPTMGALHKGHESLIERSIKENDTTIVSIFVNPIQFGPSEDFNKYPRPFENDKNICERLGVDILFNPEKEEIFGDNFLTFVDIEKLQNNLCGVKRPGHFRGVCTIVAKLFNIVTPDRAYFGKKDIQQLIIISKMVEDLNFDIEVIPCPIVREKDGLAMSSRNSYLTPEERKDATILNIAIKEAISMIENGEKNSNKIISSIEKRIKSVPSARIDYVKIVNKDMIDQESVKNGDILALAVFIGTTRLIDNHIIGEEINW
ncbi:MAG TPA: pantoate--beta-alanine ligase [Spirochaetota bacterium]|nr:pantoate--beta-alanine ligase [Spirochaetota bacterium]HOL56666.1 pantoate--beta-alanine ligase [Spirochaetota bacterium]HPP03302.1 pantoate--beta-alanine ligase [Spirochaetota bacterium]